jgi:hypothetical protein
MLTFSLKANARPPNPCHGSPTLADGTPLTISGATVAGAGRGSGSGKCAFNDVKMSVNWQSTPKINQTNVTSTWVATSGSSGTSGTGEIVGNDSFVSLSGSSSALTVTLDTGSPNLFLHCVAAKRYKTSITGGTIAAGTIITTTTTTTLPGGGGGGGGPGPGP